MQGGRAQRGDDADAARHGGQSALAPGLKQAFGLEFGLELQELLKQRALASPAHGFDNQLQIAARAVNVQTAAQFDQFAVFRGEIQQAGGAAEHGAADLPSFVFQREITMPAGCAREARNLTAHRNRIEPRIQRVSNGAAQRANLPDSWRICWGFSFKHQTTRTF